MYVIKAQHPCRHDRQPQTCTQTTSRSGWKKSALEPETGERCLARDGNLTHCATVQTNGSVVQQTWHGCRVFVAAGTRQSLPLKNAKQDLSTWASYPQVFLVRQRLVSPLCGNFDAGGKTMTTEETRVPHPHLSTMAQRVVDSPRVHRFPSV